MKNKFSNACSVLTIGLVFASCGGHGGGRGSQDHNEEEALKDPNAQFALKFATGAKAADTDLSSILWSANVSVNFASGEKSEMQKNRVALKIIQDEIAKIKVHAGDTVDFKITLEKMSTEKSNVIATNVEGDAFRDETTKSIWSTQCQEFEKSAFKIDLEGLRAGRYAMGADGKSLTVAVKVCDFENFLVAPVVSIEPQPAIQLHNVTFRCVGTNDPRYSLVSLNKPACRFGNRPEQNIAALENVVPTGTEVAKEFKPEMSVNFSNTYGRQQYDLSVYFSDWSQLPLFARQDNGCTKMDVVLYELDNPSKEYRLHFTNNGEKWVTKDDIGNRPKLSNPSTLEFFLHCYWRGEARAGSTVTIPFAGQ